MEITELFKDSLKYPIQDWTKLLLLGVLFLIPSILAVIPLLAIALRQTVAFWILFLIFIIVGILVLLIISGYSLKITRETILENNDLPSLDYVKNIIDGLKLFAVEIVYYIIPLIITIIMIYVTGLFEKFTQIMHYTLQTSLLASQNATTPVIPPELIMSFAFNAFFVGIISFIIFVLATLFLMIATARLAETEKLAEAFNCKEVFGDIAKIGWGKYIAWFILLFLIIFVISMIVGALQSIPFIGFIIVLVMILLVEPFILLFMYRATGLIYKESKG